MRNKYGCYRLFCNKVTMEYLSIFSSSQENYIKYLYFDFYNQKTRIVAKEFGRNLEDTVRNLKRFSRNLSKSQTFR